MAHGHLRYLVREAAYKFDEVRSKQTPGSPLVHVDDPECVELGNLVMENVRREAKFLFQDFGETSSVFLILLLPPGRLVGNLFGDDPVPDQVLEKRCHERARDLPAPLLFG